MGEDTLNGIYWQLPGSLDYFKCYSQRVRLKLCKSSAEFFRPVEPYSMSDRVKPTAVAYGGISVVLLALG